MLSKALELFETNQTTSEVIVGVIVGVAQCLKTIFKILLDYDFSKLSIEQIANGVEHEISPGVKVADIPKALIMPGRLHSPHVWTPAAVASVGSC